MYLMPIIFKIIRFGRMKITMNNYKNEDLITDYQQNILKPLDTFYTEHYKDAIENKETEVSKLLDQEYNLYLEKLETFGKLIDDFIFKNE